jgi:hypothetical protein
LGFLLTSLHVPLNPALPSLILPESKLCGSDKGTPNFGTTTSVLAAFAIDFWFRKVSANSYPPDPPKNVCQMFSLTLIFYRSHESRLRMRQNRESYPCQFPGPPKRISGFLLIKLRVSPIVYIPRFDYSRC